MKIGRARRGPRDAGTGGRLRSRRRGFDARGHDAVGQRARAAGAIAGTLDRRLIHDPPDRPRAPAALRAAAEAAIDLARHAGSVRAQDGANLMIGQHVARTDDHWAVTSPWRPWTQDRILKDR